MKRLITIITLIGLANPVMAMTPATDLELCIQSYETTLDNETALMGCASGKLDGLSTEQQFSIDIMTPAQFNEIQTVIQYQAETGCDWEDCVEAIFG